MIDGRSIKDVQTEDLMLFDRCHFFAGILGWEFALQLAGWPVDIPVWTASLPCQPFSIAGKHGGENDERHLWPVFRNLVSECEPGFIFGEQVASPAGRNWFSSLQIDLEEMGYVSAAVDLCAASIGAPHIRQRLFWVAYSRRRGMEHLRSKLAGETEGSPEAVRQGTQRVRYDSGNGGNVDRMAYPHGGQLGCPVGRRRNGDETGRGEGTVEPQARGENGRLALSDSEHGWPGARRGDRQEASDGGGMGHALGQGLEGHTGDVDDRSQPGWIGAQASGPVVEAGECGDRMGYAHGPEGEGLRSLGLSVEPEQEPEGPRYATPWSRAGLVVCADEKARPVEPGVYPLADGLPGRVDILRGYGNSIVPHLAAEFIMAFMEGLTDD